MPAIKGIVVSVNYGDLLSITLPRNARFLTDILVITHPDDHETKRVAATVPSAKVYETDSFYKHGASFNKGLAMEEGFDIIGRDGWICVWDADTLFPENLVMPEIQPGILYGAKRMIVEDIRRWSPDVEWWKWPYPGDGMMAKMFPGYFHLFHGSDPKLVNDRPWYDCTFRHAGGGDGFFQSRWSFKEKAKQVLPFFVLHMGPRDTNWFGRATPTLDGRPGSQEAREAIDRFHRVMGWCHHRDRIADPSFSEHIEVPGHSPKSWVHERWC